LRERNELGSGLLQTFGLLGANALRQQAGMRFAYAHPNHPIGWDGFAYPQNVVYMFRVKNRCCVANIIHLKEYEKNMVVE